MYICTVYRPGDSQLQMMTDTAPAIPSIVLTTYITTCNY